MIRGSLLTRVRALFRDSHAAGLPMVLAIVNDPSSGLDAATFHRTVMACAVQAQRDVAPEYGLPPPTIVEMGHDDPRPPPAVDGGLVAVIACVGEIPETPQDAGWHKPLGSGDRFDGFVSTQGMSPSQWSEVMSHEIAIETLVDPMCDRVHLDRDGVAHPEEPADAAQAGDDSQRVPIEIDGVTVYMSNWVLPTFFQTDTPDDAVVDYLSRARGLTGDARLVPGPFKRAAFGYENLTYPDGSNRNVFGASHPGVLPERAQHADARPSVLAAKALRRVAAAKLAARSVHAEEEVG